MTGRSGRTGLTGLLLVALAAAPLAGQAFVRIGAGGTVSTALVGEVFVEPISQKQSVSPTAAAQIGWTFAQGYRLAIEGRYASGTFEVHDDALATSDELGGLATLQVGVVADGPLRGAFRWEATVGLLHYMPEQAIGVFRDDNPTRLLLGGGIAWSHPLGSTLRMIIAARYDYHAFNSVRLQTDSYSGTQAVHRGSLTLGLEREL